MTEADVKMAVQRLTEGERNALRSLPVRDRGGLPDEIWWQYHALIDQGLATGTPDFWLKLSPLGESVLTMLGDS